MSGTNHSFNVIATKGIVDSQGLTGTVGQVLSKTANDTLIWASAGIGNTIIPGQSIYFSGSASNTIINVSSVITYLSSISSLEGYIANFAVSSINGQQVNPYNPNPAFSTINTGAITASTLQTNPITGFVNTVNIDAKSISTAAASISTLNVSSISSSSAYVSSLAVSSINGQPYASIANSDKFSTIFTSSIATSTIKTAADGYVSTNTLNAAQTNTSSIQASTLQMDAVNGYVSTNAVISFQTLANTINASTITTNAAYGIVNTPYLNTTNISTPTSLLIQSPYSIAAAVSTNNGLYIDTASTVMSNVSSINGVPYVPYTTVENFSSVITSSIFTNTINASTIYTSSLRASTIQTYNFTASNISTSEIFTSSLKASTISTLAVYASTGTISSLTSENIFASSLQASSINTYAFGASTISTTLLFSSSLQVSSILASSIRTYALAASTISSVNTYTSSLQASTITTQNLGASTISSVNIYTSSLQASTISSWNLGASTISSVNIFTSSLSASSINALSTYTSSLFTSSISSFWIEGKSLPVAVSASNYVQIAAGNIYPSTVTNYNMYLISPRVPNLAGRNYIISAQFSISSLAAVNDSFVSQIFTTNNASPPYTWSPTNYSTVRTNTQNGAGSHIQTNSHLYSGTQTAVSTIFALGIALTIGATPTNYPIINAYMNILTNV